LSDRIGRKGVLIAAQVAGLLGFSLLAAGTALWTVFVSRAIEGLGGGGLGVTQAYVTDVTTPANRARAFGLIGATLGAGFLIGPALAGVLVRYGYRVPFAVAAGLQLITVILTLVLLPDSKGAVKTAPTFAEIRASLRSPLLGRLLLTQFTFWISFTSWVTVFALFTERVLGYGPAQTSYLFIVSSIVSIGIQAGLIGRLVDRHGEGRIAVAGLCCAVTAYASVFFVTTSLALYAWIVLWSLSSALLRPALGALIAEAAPEGQRGTILSVGDSLNGVAFLIAPLVATAVIGVNPRLVGIMPFAFVCIALAIGYRVFTSPRTAQAVEIA
jgi:DHA1 family tetracycline resistance protein-like MFS transporter